MSIRVFFLIAFGLLILPYLVFLRSAQADTVCNMVGKSFYLIASERDSGTPPAVLLEKFYAMHSEGRLTREALGTLASWIIVVYSSDKTADELRQDAVKTCKKSRGKIDA